MALTVDTVNEGLGDDVWGRARVRTVDVTFDSALAYGGEAFAPSAVGLHEIDAVLATNIAGFNVVYDKTNEKLRILAFPEADTTVQVTDDDSAASNGTDVFVVVDDPTLGTAHLESVNAGNADAVVELADGDTVTVQDDDSAASNGVALSVDEDQASDTALQADLSSIAEGRDVYVRTDNNRWFRVRNASSGGVAVHFDDDGATETDRLLFVSPTDANATVSLDAEVQPSSDLSSVVATSIVVGR